MKSKITQFKKLPLALALLGACGSASAGVFIQCPGDDYITDPFTQQMTPGHDGIPDEFYPDAGGLSDPTNPNPNFDPSVKCMHLSAGDGYSTMADGKELYIFSFGDITGVPEADSLKAGLLAAEIPAPTIVLDEGDQFFLTLTNVGMVRRPDLEDPHTIHYHGYPNAASVMDGVPDVSISVNMHSSLAYYYNIATPGTYMYHCHVEAAEHMQMGMLGNLYVHSAQDQAPNGTMFGTWSHRVDAVTGEPIDRYAYNDGDASTRYDVEFPIQIGSFDPVFHDASESTQPLPFANMKDTHPLLNGRGYPDTLVKGNLPAPTGGAGVVSQKVSSLVEATSGQKILLRISNLNVTNYYTLRTLGLPPMKVVGKGAALLRGPNGDDLYYDTNSVTLGGGEAVDVIINTAGVTPGTYHLYTTNLNYLSNDAEDYGGMMTEIVIN